MSSDINLLAVAAGGIVYMIVGAAWYSPVLFAKTWMQAVGKSEKELKESANPLMYLATFACELLAVYVLAHFVFYAGADTAVEGLVTGVWAWLGFTATTAYINHSFAGRSTALYLIDQSYHLVALGLAGAILGVWQ